MLQAWHVPGSIFQAYHIQGVPYSRLAIFQAYHLPTLPGDYFNFRILWKVAGLERVRVALSLSELRVASLERVESHGLRGGQSRASRVWRVAVPERAESRRPRACLESPASSVWRAARLACRELPASSVWRVARLERVEIRGVFIAWKVVTVARV